MSTTRRRSLNRGASCYKHIFAAVVGERLPRQPADSASTSGPATSTRPSHLFLVAHHRLEVAPSSHLAPDAHVLLMPKTLATATVDPHHPHSTTRRSPSYARQPPLVSTHKSGLLASTRRRGWHTARRQGTVSSPGHDLDRCGALLGSPTRARSSSATRAVDAVPSRAIAPYLSICASNTARPSRISWRPASLRPGG